MRKLSIFVISLCIVLISCSSKKDTPASVAQKWCDLNGKAYRAEGAAKEAAEKARDEYESKMEAKYKNDEAFMREMGKEVEKCEDASEGK